MVANFGTREFLTISEVCRQFNVHPNTLRNWDRQGILKAVRIGARKDRRYRKDDVLSFFYGRKIVSKNKLSDEQDSLKSNFVNEVRPLGNLLPKAPEGEG